MIVDGKQIARAVLQELAADVTSLHEMPKLAIVSCAPDLAAQTYLGIKNKQAATVGIVVENITLPANVSTDDCVAAVQKAAVSADGIIVQLPLPKQIDTTEVLKAITINRDVDAIHYDGQDPDMLPPVVGAIAEIAKWEDIDFTDKKIVIVGTGRLVGAPAKIWCETSGWNIVVVTEDTKNPEAYFRQADILILGAGSAGLITPEKIKTGVVIFDAGASEVRGILVGDADPACAQKAAYMTPVPGGIGPITVAILLRNLVLLHKRSR